MYHIDFARPNSSLMRRILQNQSYFDTYIDGLMFIHDLICDLPIRAEHSEFTPAVIHENMAEMMKPDVYISYSTRDRLDLAVNLVNALQDHNINVWVWLPGTSIPDENWAAPLKYSVSFLSILSQEGAKSQNVLQEWNQAINLQIPMVALVSDQRDYTKIPHLEDKTSHFFIPIVENIEAAVQSIQSILQTSSRNDHLPFEIVDNLRQNYDGARRIRFLGKDLQFHPDTLRQTLEEQLLNLEDIATRYVNGLLQTYTTLLNMQEIFREG